MCARPAPVVAAAPAKARWTMMPIGVPKVAYRVPGAPSADWVDIYNRLYRERIIFLGQEIDDEVGGGSSGAEEGVGEGQCCRFGLCGHSGWRVADVARVQLWPRRGGHDRLGATAVTLLGCNPACSRVLPELSLLLSSLS